MAHSASDVPNDNSGVVPGRYCYRKTAARNTSTFKAKPPVETGGFLLNSVC